MYRTLPSPAHGLAPRSPPHPGPSLPGMVIGMSPPLIDPANTDYSALGVRPCFPHPAVRPRPLRMRSNPPPTPPSPTPPPFLRPDPWLNPFSAIPTLPYTSPLPSPNNPQPTFTLTDGTKTPNYAPPPFLPRLILRPGYPYVLPPAAPTRLDAIMGAALAGIAAPLRRIMK